MYIPNTQARTCWIGTGCVFRFEAIVNCPNSSVTHNRTHYPWRFWLAWGNPKTKKLWIFCCAFLEGTLIAVCFTACWVSMRLDVVKKDYEKRRAWLTCCTPFSFAKKNLLKYQPNLMARSFVRAPNCCCFTGGHQARAIDYFRLSRSQEAPQVINGFESFRRKRACCLIASSCGGVFRQQC